MPTYRIRLFNADGLDRAQLAQAGRTGVVPALRPVVKPPVNSFLPRKAVGGTATQAAAAQTVYPGMYVPPGTPTNVVDSATYAGGTYPADIYQYMTTADCQQQVPNGGYYTKNRYSSCAVHQVTATLQECDSNGQNCVTVGTASWRQTSVGQGNDGNQNGGAAVGSRVITYEVTIDRVTTTGNGASFTLKLDMSCAAQGGWRCTPNQGNGRSATIATWMTPGNNTATFTFTSPIADGSGGDHIVVAAAAVTATVSWTDPATGVTVSASTDPANASAAFRFDSAGRNPAWSTKWTGYVDGVVFDIVPVISFNGSCGDVNCNAITRSVSHIQLAFTNAPGTMPPWSGGGLKPAIPGAMRNANDWLSRTTDDTRIGLNRTSASWACTNFLAAVANSACDEYPFASSYQGAGSGGPYSALRINTTDNSEAGARLGAFYTLQRMLDCNPLTGGDGCDAFGVQVIGNAAPPPYPYVVIDEVGGGAFADEWTATGGAEGTLSAPIDAEYTVSGGQEQDFTGGSIYWSSGTGTHEVHGAILSDYNHLGGPGSQLGFPLSDQQSAPGGGQENLFPGTSCGSSTGSVILWSSSTPASEMQGCIYQAYLNTYGGPAGSLGYPTSNEQGISTGRVNYLVGTSCGSSAGSAIYWNGAAHAVTGCIFQQYKSMGEAAGSLGFPTGDAFSISGGIEQIFQHGFITDINGAIAVHPWLVGHAGHAGNDYPYETIGQFDHQNEGTDAWNEYYGQCDSFTAWKVYENLAGSAAQHPSIVPAPGWTPSNASISPVNQFTWGNADVWATKWQALGYTVDAVPAPGAIAYWPNAVTDPQDGNPPDSVHGIGEFGHVGYVTDVYPDGSITLEQYNMRENGEYSVVHMNFNTGYTDNSFGQPNFSVPWPKYFIHVADGPSGAASSAEPSPGVVQAGYPSQVKVIGPGSSASQFSTGNVWYTRAGHGEIGAELWTHTNGPTAVSTATWTPSGLTASTCYRVDAFVPDNYSDNPTAIYTIADAAGTSYAAVNENVQTNDWSELGVFKTNGSGGLSVKLDDRGVTGLYVAADAMRFWLQANCNAEGDVSPIFMPSSYVGTWSALSGHGFFGAMRYTTTTGSSTSNHSASWTVGHLIPYGCYDISLYVPDNYSDNPGALYYSNDAYYGVFYPQIDENAYTNQFAWIGTFQAYGDGTLPVELFNEGPSGKYVAADAIAYTLNPHCMAENGAANAFGSVYTSSIIGPGSGPPGFSTSSDWYYQIGHGYANHELWTHTNGATPVSTATWTFYGAANSCYTASAYIPNNYANNTSASYTISTQKGTIGTSINQATSTGWTQFQGNPKLTTGSNGQITVILNDTGPTGTYTAADAISFTLTGCLPCCLRCRCVIR